MEVLDLIIVGGGPIGIAVSLEAKKKGLSSLIIEKGCIANSLYNYPVNMQFFSTSEKLEIDDIPFISNESKPRRSEALEYYRRIVTSNNLAIKLFEKVSSISKKDTRLFEVCTDKTNYSSRNIVIASGFYDIPNKIGVKGEELSKVTHYYKDPHYYSGQKVVVIGASNSAVDAALECYRKGAEVTMVVRGPEISKRVKYWVKPDIENRIAEGSIAAFFNSEVIEIREQDLIVKTAQGEKIMANDFVLALTGYEPNFNFLRKIGVELSSDEKKYPQYNPETMETNVPGIYLAGVICGGMDTHKWFIENSRIHAKKIIKAVSK